MHEYKLFSMHVASMYACMKYCLHVCYMDAVCMQILEGLASNSSSFHSSLKETKPLPETEAKVELAQ